jgi:hypothetical protein
LKYNKQTTGSNVNSKKYILSQCKLILSTYKSIQSYSTKKESGRKYSKYECYVTTHTEHNTQFFTLLLVQGCTWGNVIENTSHYTAINEYIS